METISHIIKKGSYDNKTYASVSFTKWGEPLYNDIRFVNEWSDIASLPNLGNVLIKHNSDKFKDKQFIDYEHMIKNTLWIFNNEKLNYLFHKLSGSENVLMPASGIAWILQLLNEKTKNLTICDISKTQIKFVDEILSNWDGINYGEFVFKFILKNHVIHVHDNLNEKENSDLDMKNKDNFIEQINNNFKMLILKYLGNTNFSKEFQKNKQKCIITKNTDLLDESVNFNFSEIYLSNILGYKYNFINNNVDKFTNLIDPATKLFIKSPVRTNPHKHPPCVKLDLNVPVDDIHKEINNIKQYIVPHRYNTCSIGWGGFCIHGQAYNRTREDEFYNNYIEYDWTNEAILNMPKTIKFLKSLPATKFFRVRIMALAPKSFIKVHHDYTVSKLNNINIAITQPDNCPFYLEHHGIIDFKPGDSYLMNLVNYHCVINYSNETRYHMIIHSNYAEQ